MAPGLNTSSENEKSSVSPSQSELPEKSNEDLLVAVANFQDQAAYRQLFARFAKRVYGLGMKLAHNEQISKDLVQEVMLTVWQNANAFDLDRGSAQSWIFSMARNKCIDLLRKTGRAKVSISADDVWMEDLHVSEAVSSQFETDGAAVNADIERLKRFSERLPDPQREAIELVYVQDNTHEEAAVKLSVPLGTFKSRLRLGLIKLREMVKDRHE